MPIYDNVNAGSPASAPIVTKGVATRAVVELGEGKSNEMAPIPGTHINLNGPATLQWPQQEPSHKTDTSANNRKGKWRAVDWYQDIYFNRTGPFYSIPMQNHNFETGDQVVLIAPIATQFNNMIQDRVLTYHVNVSGEAVSACFISIYVEADSSNEADIICFEVESADDDPVDSVSISPSGELQTNPHTPSTENNGRVVTHKISFPRVDNVVGSGLPNGAQTYNINWGKVSNPAGGAGMWFVNKTSTFNNVGSRSEIAGRNKYLGNGSSGIIGDEQAEAFWVHRGTENSDGTSDSITLHTTKAGAIADDATTRMYLGAGDGGTSGTQVHIIDIKEFTKSKNSCFDYQSGLYPSFSQWNGYPSDHENFNINQAPTNIMNAPQLWWRHYSPILLSWDGFKGFTGCDWLSTSGAHDLVDPSKYQRRIMKLYGSGSTDPAGFDSRPQAGIRFMNHDRAGNPAEYDNHGPVFSHITSDNNYHTMVYDGTMLHGLDRGWARHEFTTILLTSCPQSTWHTSQVVEPGETSKGNRFDKFPITDESGGSLTSRTLPLNYVKPGGKIKFQAKVRVPEDDTFRTKNFGGMYVTLVYPSTTYGHHTCAIYYVMFKNSADTINLPTGRLTGHAGRNNWQGLMPYTATKFPQKALRPNDKTVTEVAVHNAEDFRAFKHVSHEIDIPADFDTNSKAVCKISLSLYFAENGANMSGTLSAAQGGNDEAPDVDGVNSQNLNMQEIEIGKSYQLKDKGSLNYVSINAIAGTTLGTATTSNNVVPGRIYTFTNTTGAQEDWSALYIDDLGGGEFPASDLTADEREGMQVKIGPGTNLGALNGNATIQRGGHPVNSVIKVQDIPGGSSEGVDAEFKPLTGSIDIFSPIIEYYNTI